MPRPQALYDEIQYDLVIRSEEPHEVGLRDKSISGDICNHVLIDFLRVEYPHFQFSPGIITQVERRRESYHYASSDPRLGPQADIVAFVGRPFEQFYDYVVVPLRQVKLIIETKKWISPADVKGEQKQIHRLKKFARKPVLLAAFRHTGDLNHLQKQCAADYFFAFAGPSQSYPQYDKTFMSKGFRSGQLLKFCEIVDKLLYSTES